MPAKQPAALQEQLVSTSDSGAGLFADLMLKWSTVTMMQIVLVLSGWWDLCVCVCRRGGCGAEVLLSLFACEVFCFAWVLPLCYRCKWALIIHPPNPSVTVCLTAKPACPYTETCKVLMINSTEQTQAAV